ncbi:MAG: TetR family transcriptional regulator [Rhodospirillales bacterium]|nr:MAG: TetR family transcriptional regulator [Rhodospirillales bacterium]
MGRAAIHVDNRRDELLAAAARRFARGGFDATSMRDIAGDVGMLAGSMYYHFPSKDDLIAAVYALGVAQITDAVGAALARAGDRPWVRLEAACAAHLEALLDASPFARVMIVDLSRCAPALRRRLVASRDAYEAVFRGLVAALPAGAPSDRRLLRLQLLGSLNAVPGWYRPGGATPADIARAFVAALRGG